MGKSLVKRDGEPEDMMIKVIDAKRNLHDAKKRYLDFCQNRDKYSGPTDNMEDSLWHQLWAAYNECVDLGIFVKEEYKD